MPLIHVPHTAFFVVYFQILHVMLQVRWVPWISRGLLSDHLGPIQCSPPITSDPCDLWAPASPSGTQHIEFTVAKGKGRRGRGRGNEKRPGMVQKICMCTHMENGDEKLQCSVWACAKWHVPFHTLWCCWPSQDKLLFVFAFIVTCICHLTAQKHPV